MAIGRAAFQGAVDLEGLTSEQALALCHEAASDLGWRIRQVAEEGFVAYTKISWRSYSEEVRVQISGESAEITSECTSSQLYDWGKNKDNVKELTEKIRNLLNSYSPSELDYKYKEIAPRLTSHLEVAEATTVSSGRVSSFISIFIPRQGYFITPLLLNVNLLVFVIMIASGIDFFKPEVDDMIKWGANLRHLVLNGEYWRLISSCFLHIGMLHLLMNMYALVYIGILLEPKLGRLKFLTAFILTGIAASVNSAWWHTLTVSAGASGAIFGLYGVFLALLTTNHIDKATRKPMLTSIGIFVVYNLLNGLKTGIDNAAHIGGLLSGIVIGYSFYPVLRNRTAGKLAYLIVPGLIAVTGLSSFFALKKVETFGATVQNEFQIEAYKKKMEQFASMESMALEVLQMHQSTPKYEIQKAIEERGLYYWQENLDLVQKADRLSLPDVLHKRNKRLIDYCNLRIKSYKLLYKSLEPGGEQYQQEMFVTNNELAYIIKELTNVQNE